MTESLDALTYSEIRNNMTDNDSLDMWRGQLFTTSGTLTDKQVADKLDQILSSTTIKRACCLGNNLIGDNTKPLKVNVRIPIPTGMTDLPAINKKFGYYDRVVYVPRSMCGQYVKSDKRDVNYNNQCDDFYQLYCANMLDLFQSEKKAMGNNSSVDPVEFLQYKPECACYNVYKQFQNNGVPLSPRCLMYPSCSDANNDTNSVYMDPLSRQQCPQNLNLTVCSQIVDLTGVGAGGNIGVSPELSNQCSSSGSNTGSNTGSGGSNTGSGGSNTGSGGSNTGSGGSNTGSGGSNTGSGGSNTGSGGSNTGSGGSSGGSNTGSNTGSNNGSSSDESSVTQTSGWFVTVSFDEDNKPQTHLSIFSYILIAIIILCILSSSFMMIRKRGKN